MTLAAGETARFLTNGRHTTSEGGQYYTRTIYNVALTPASREDLFLRAEPGTTLRFEADLF